MPSSAGPLEDAFVSGATVVTPNRRLARALVARHDEAQRAAGLAVWPAARALPWDAWLTTLWQQALEADIVPDGARLRTPVQAAHAWNRIVAANAAPLIDARGAAVLAADAWSIVHAWGASGESWRAWAGSGDVDDDASAFARWAARYAAALAASSSIDPAQLPDRLAAWATRIAALRGARFVLAGFIEFSPQQERLIAALVAAGAHIARENTLPAKPGLARLACGATPRDELALALAWARDRALARPSATIGIVVEDLAGCRDEVQALADDIVCPALQWPAELETARPYNLSLGTALSDVPLVAAALDLIGWADAPLPVGRAAALLRSPYVAVGPDAWMLRARLEADWLKQGRRSISMRGALGALRDADQPLAQRWADARDRHRVPAHGTPRAFAEAWREWLAALGWPGSRVQGSAEYQARAVWDDALATFATLGSVEAELARVDALAALRAQLTAAIFQPESPPAPIQILGVLEAAGLPFDALWVAGLAAERWPAAPQPNPLLPIVWQRERNVPRASAARELAYAQALTAQFARAAPQVVFSYARSADDHSRSPSWLLPAAPPLASDEVAIPVSTARVQFALAASRERMVDDRAPQLPAGSPMRGGASLIEAQGDCPFKAAATYRLAAETWPVPVDGLSAQERGTLAHAALTAFWCDVRTQAALVELAPATLAAKIAAAVEAAIVAIPAARWRNLLPVVAAGESARLATLVGSWLQAQERDRPPFSVLGTEMTLPLTLGGLSLQLRLDRLDALADGGTAIIDYKTGRTKPPEAWFEPRPQAPQLGLYALARRAAAPAEHLRAVAYAQIRPGEFKVHGIAADNNAWPALKLPSSLRKVALADWSAVEARWAASLGALAADIAAGAAAVAPRDARKTCAHCGLQPFCRIGALAIADRERNEDE